MRTKIVATLGPASSSRSMVTKMIQNGMHICRLNFSHGTHEEHAELIRIIRSAEKKAKKHVAILQDLQGPKIRIGDIQKSELHTGERVTFTTSMSVKKVEHIPVTYAQLHKDLKKGHRILLDDGLIECVVTSIRGRAIHAIVKHGGEVSAHKGMNFPDSVIRAKTFTEKDEKDLQFGMQHGVDYIALSFVTSAEDIKAVRAKIQKLAMKHHASAPNLLAKIERKQAVDHITEIITHADGIMLARGDLGVEMPFEEVPVIQKEVVELCREAGKPVIVATHMLDSMTRSPRATRAEVSDVANAVMDHADAVMLSQETAIGQYPDISVKTMATVIQEAEQSRFDDIQFHTVHGMQNIGQSLALALHAMAENVQIDSIVTSCEYGSLIHTVNMYRPNVPIYVTCPSQELARKWILQAGVHPVVARISHAQYVVQAERMLRQKKILFKTKTVAYITAAASGQIQLTIR